MHEAHFTQEIVQEILKELYRYPTGRIKEVKVRVGEMLHLVPESVQLHYRLFTQGTELEKVPLRLQEAPVRILCRRCRREGGVEDHHLLMCSFCSSFEVDLKQGSEVQIEPIEIENTDVLKESRKGL